MSYSQDILNMRGIGCPDHRRRSRGIATLRERLEADGWEVLPAARLDDEPTDLEITSGEQLRTLTDGFRLRLLAALGRRPGSAKDLAARFDVPTTRLYHHLDLLEEHDFIEVVATRRSGARTERCYGVPPRRSLRPGAALVESGDRSELAAAVRALTELVGATLERGVLDGLLDIPTAGIDDGPDLVSWSAVRLTDEQRRSFARELAELGRRVVQASSANDTDDAATPLTLFTVLAPDPLAATD